MANHIRFWMLKNSELSRRASRSFALQNRRHYSDILDYEYNAAIRVGNIPSLMRCSNELKHDSWADGPTGRSKRRMDGHSSGALDGCSEWPRYVIASDASRRSFSRFLQTFSCTNAAVRYHLYVAGHYAVLAVIIGDIFIRPTRECAHRFLYSFGHTLAGWYLTELVRKSRIHHFDLPSAKLFWQEGHDNKMPLMMSNPFMIHYRPSRLGVFRFSYLSLSN